MAHAVSVRLDEEAVGALNRLTSTGISQSEAIRSALVEAANRLYDMDSLAAEAKALEADEFDRAEMLAVAEMMESLRAER
ncbi:MAG: ribbon-helix-helix protein, CopG family [Acidimicrobiia bacterium]|nr:ribbon-helix-helix protein, CopG family [Acidimicrobiia bacterium]MCY4434656.1 ribbon-helix-helix protein, CopG family [bacterium]